MWGVVPGRRGYRRRSETGVEPGAPAAQRDGCRDSSDAGEPAVLTTMSAAMHRYVEVVKQYPGPEQVDMRVEIEVPGSWFGAGPMGALTDAERREKYTAQAVEYAEVREFPGACRGSRKTKEQAIRFICAADAADEPSDSSDLACLLCHSSGHSRKTSHPCSTLRSSPTPSTRLSRWQP